MHCQNVGWGGSKHVSAVRFVFVRQLFMATSNINVSVLQRRRRKQRDAPHVVIPQSKSAASPNSLQLGSAGTTNAHVPGKQLLFFTHARHEQAVPTASKSESAEYGG